MREIIHHLLRRSQLACGQPTRTIAMNCQLSSRQIECVNTSYTSACRTWRLRHLMAKLADRHNARPHEPGGSRLVVLVSIENNAISHNRHSWQWRIKRRRRTHGVRLRRWRWRSSDGRVCTRALTRGTFASCRARGCIHCCLWYFHMSGFQRSMRAAVVRSEYN